MESGVQVERSSRHNRPIIAALLATALLAAGTVEAQQPTAPPAVGVAPATKQSITQATEYTGRIQSTNRVNLVARVSAFLDKIFFAEGTEVKKGDLLYRLEQGPFKADLQAKQAAVDQYRAQLKNAQLTRERAQTLLKGPAGQQSAYDSALAAELALQAQVKGAEAQLAQSQINLDYTEIHAPIDGKIGRTAVTVGNYVNSNTGFLTSIVSQDPMYVVFPVSTRSVIHLQSTRNLESKPMVIKLRLPDTRIYGQTGTLDFIDNTVTLNTDTMTVRGLIPNPKLANSPSGARELVDGEFVTAIVEDPEPLETLTVPRAAVLSDQQGDYVYVVGSDNKAQQRRIKLGQSTPLVAAVLTGLNEGDNVVVDGLQRVRPNMVVAPGPMAPRVQPPAGTTPAAATANPATDKK